MKVLTVVLVLAASLGARAQQVSVGVVSVQPLQNAIEQMEEQGLKMQFGAIVELSIPIVERLGVNQQLGALTADAYKAGLARASLNLVDQNSAAPTDKNTVVLSVSAWMTATPEEKVSTIVDQLAVIAGASQKDASAVAAEVTKELTPKLRAATQN